jgi:hypothetical protein
MKSTLAMAALAAMTLSGFAGAVDAKQPMHHPRHQADFFGFEDGPFGRHCMRFGHARHCNDIGMFDRHITCGEARYRVAARGYSKVVTKNCAGFTYLFTGSKKGKRYSIKVNARSGFMSASRL